MLGRETLTLLSPESQSACALCLRSVPFVVIATSSMPIAIVPPIISARSLLSSGSPPVYLTLFTPTDFATRTMLSTSSRVISDEPPPSPSWWQ